MTTADAGWARLTRSSTLVPLQPGTPHALPAPFTIAPPGRPSMPGRLAGAVHAGRPGLVAPAADALVLLAVAPLTLAGRPTQAAAAALVVVCMVLSGRVYRDRDRVVSRGTGWWPRLLLGPAAVAGLLLTMVVGTPEGAVFALTAVLSLSLLRVVAWVMVARLRRQGRECTAALVVGRDDRAGTLARTLARHPEYGLHVDVVVDESVLTDVDELGALIQDRGCGHVFLIPGDALAPAGLRRALGVDAHVSLIPFGSDAFLDGRTSGRVGGVAVLPLGRPLRGPAPMRGKRALDVVVAGLLLLLVSPVLLAAALAVKLDDGGPVLFRQRRTGRGGTPFDIVKLRTMRANAEAELALLTAYNTTDGLLFKMVGDPRVTRSGALLRRSGLDELPQLLNVLRGEMSLVGPRPLPVDSAAFGAREDQRHLVRPGMTGLWQVSGGAMLRYREMVDLDVAYVHGWTPGLDLHILGATLGVLLRASLGTEGHER